MTALEYLEKIDNTLSHWEDYFHGQEGDDVTEARGNLDKVRKQLLNDVVPKETLCNECYDTDGFYLGTTCPKCKEPFRNVKA